MAQIPASAAQMRAAQAARQIPGGIRQIRSKPGLLYDPVRRKYFKIVDTTVHWQYDTESFIAGAAGVVANGSGLAFAQNIQNKQPLDCNFNQSRRLTAGQTMWVTRVGLYIPQYVSGYRQDYDDVQAVIENAYLQLFINNKELVKGPAVVFPAGAGWSGTTTKTNSGVVSLGLPSLAGVLPLAKPIFLNENYDIDPRLTIQGHAQLPALSAALAPVTPVLQRGTGVGVANAYVAIKFVLHGRLYSPSTV